MNRPVTLASAQWSDLTLEQTALLAAQMGYDGVEAAVSVHIDAGLAAEDEAYREQTRQLLRENALGLFALDARSVTDRLAFPYSSQDEPAAVRAADELVRVAKAASALNVGIVTGTMPAPAEFSAQAYDAAAALWDPVFAAFGSCGIRFAADVEPGCLAFDYYTAERLLDRFDDTLGLNFDPAPLEWQGVNPAVFIRDFAQRIVHVRLRDAAVRLDGKSGILGSLLPSGDTRRGWNYRSVGHGDVNFEDIVRELDQADYEGPLCVQWEDAGMDRTAGAVQACEFVRELALG